MAGLDPTIIEQLNAQLATDMAGGQNPADMSNAQILEVMNQGAKGEYRGVQQQTIDETGNVVPHGQNVTDGATIALLNGAMGEFGDEVAAGAMAAGAYVGGDERSLPELYDASKQYTRQQERMLQQTNPNVAMAAKGAGIVGGAITGGGLAAKAGLKMAGTMTGRTVQGTIAGGTSGLITGAGEAESNADVGQKAIVGLGIGAVAGGIATPLMETVVRMGKPAIRRALRAFIRDGGSKRNDVADQLVLEALALDGMSPAQLLTKLDDVGFAGKPAVISDVSGENVAAVAEWAFGSAGRAKDVAAKMFQERNEGATGRFLKDAAEHLTDGRKFFDTFEQMAKQRADEAAPLYREAFEAEPVWSPALQGLFKRPSIKKAWARAQELAAEEGKTLPKTLEIIDDKLVVKAAPDWQSLHYIQRALRDVGSIEKRLNGATDLSRQVRGTLKQLHREMDKLNPAYAKARAQYSDQSSVIDAMEDGLSILAPDGKKAEGLFEARIKGIEALSKAEREAYRLGASRALLSVAYAPGGERRMTRRVLRDPRIQALMRAAWDDPKQADMFFKRLRAEMKMADRQNAISGNSRTAFRDQVRSVAEAPTMAGRGAGVAEQVANFNAGSAIRKAIAGQSKRASPGEIIDRATAMTPLFSIDPAARKAYVEGLERLAREPYAPRMPNSPAHRPRIGVAIGSGELATPAANQVIEDLRR